MATDDKFDQNTHSDKPGPVEEAELEATYSEMAADADREREALEWSEALIGDGINADPLLPNRAGRL